MTNILRIHSGGIDAPSLVRMAMTEFQLGHTQQAVDSINSSCFGGNDAVLARDIVSGKTGIRVEGRTVIVTTAKSLLRVMGGGRSGKLV